MHARRALGLFATIALMLAPALPGSAQTIAPEYVIKAAYLFKFTPFVEWPASAFATASSPFNICVLGADVFGSSLDDATSGRTVGAHPVKVRRLQARDEMGDCQILYLGSSRALVTAALDRVRGTPVLTVTEQSLGPPGGVVQFLVKDGHVRFVIDAGAAATNRVTISAKLLSLAAANQAGS